MALEAKIMEMSSYKSEMLMLQSEIVKLQVFKNWFAKRDSKLKFILIESNRSSYLIFESRSSHKNTY